MGSGIDTPGARGASAPPPTESCPICEAGAAGPQPRPGLANSLEAASLRVPFRVKVALVWAVIAILLAVAFARSGFDVGWMIDKASAIVKGAWVTVLFSVIAITGATLLALLGALGRVSHNSIAYGVSGFYTSFFRGTPLIVQLFLWYLALPQLAQGLLPQEYAQWFIWPAQVAGIVGIAFNYGAYMTEIFRAGIEAVPHGQSEAAEALGMSYRQRMRRVILPQAARIVIPPTGNEFIAMIKDTALIGLLGTTLLWADPFRVAQLTGKADFRNLEALIVAALVYWGLTGIFSFFQRKLETRMSKGYVRTVPV
jgi:polar amino acid transport system permease protein